MASVEYVKHLIECKCVLPQFKLVEPPRWHLFVAFSEIDESGMIIPSFVACNNCGTIHKVTEVGVSGILARDNIPSLPNTEDIKAGLPERLAGILKSHDCDLATYQEVAWIMEHQKWGRTVILSKEVVEGFLLVKSLFIIGETLWKINSHQEEVGDNNQEVAL